jgi:ATP-dependent HslUV protease, peptidase subunit HslV
MSTLTVVQKNGVAAIAADQMSKKGSCKCPAGYESHPSKIVRLENSFIGVVGSTAHIRVVQSLVKNHADKLDLNSVDSIFETFRGIHKLLVDDYYLLTKEDDDEQPYESSQLNLLIANSTGIYEVQGYREIMQYERFWAIGCGFRFALGAMEALYGARELSAQQIAERAVEIACLFDDASGLPVESHMIPLK